MLPLTSRVATCVHEHLTKRNVHARFTCRGLCYINANRLVENTGIAMKKKEWKVQIWLRGR